MIQPFRSIPIRETSTLLRIGPPPYHASVLSFLWDFHLNRSPYIGMTGSHVLRISLCQVHAAFMPATAWAVNRLPLGFDGVPTFSTSYQRSTGVRLLDIYLIPSCGIFYSTFTTMTLDHSSLRWFESSPCRAAPEDLLPSHAQHGTLSTPDQFYCSPFRVS